MLDSRQDALYISFLNSKKYNCLENTGRGNRWASAEDVWVKGEKISTLRSVACKQKDDLQCRVIYSQPEDHAAWH